MVKEIVYYISVMTFALVPVTAHAVELIVDDNDDSTGTGYSTSQLVSANQNQMAFMMRRQAVSDLAQNNPAQITALSSNSTERVVRTKFRENGDIKVVQIQNFTNRKYGLLVFDYVADAENPNVVHVIVTYAATEADMMTPEKRIELWKATQASLPKPPPAETPASGGSRSSASPETPAISPLSRPLLTLTQYLNELEAPAAKSLFPSGFGSGPVLIVQFQISRGDFDGMLSSSRAEPAYGRGADDGEFEEVMISFEDILTLLREVADRNQAQKSPAFKEALDVLKSQTGIDFEQLGEMLEHMGDVTEDLRLEQLQEMRSYYDALIVLLKEELGIDAPPVPETDPGAVSAEEMEWREQIDGLVEKVLSGDPSAANDPAAAERFSIRHADLFKTVVGKITERYENGVRMAVLDFLKSVNRILVEKKKVAVLKSDGKTVELLIQLKLPLRQKPE